MKNTVGGDVAHSTQIIKNQKSLSNLPRDLTVFLTQENLADTSLIKPYLNTAIAELKNNMDYNVSNFSQIIKFTNDENNTLGNVISKFRTDFTDIFQDEEYKKRYTTQLTIGMACLEGVPKNIVSKIYGKNVTIDPDMQAVLKNNNLTFMDLTSRDVEFSDKDKELFVYTMLFLHDGEEKDKKKAIESGYYKVNEGGVEFKEYGIKAFEQAFNCGWQIYNEFFGNKNDKKNLPHHPINLIEEIYDLYDSRKTISHDGKQLDSHTLAGILNIARALLHIQGHKHLDYNRLGTHDPSSFVTYKKGKNRKEIYGKQIDEVRDAEVQLLWENEIATLGIKDADGNTITERSPSTYSADTKSWYMQGINFNGVKTTFSGRSKGLTSRVMKLINDPKYKKGKDVTDSLGNSFSVKNKNDGLRVWLGLIERLDEEMIDGARLDIKGTESWETLIAYIVDQNRNLLSDTDIQTNLEKLGISPANTSLLLRNEAFKSTLEKQLKKQVRLKNNKTVEGYEEFKIVTTQGTEYQISEKGDDILMSPNEFGLGNHGIYNIKKLMEILLRPNNHTMQLGHEALENIIEHALDEEELYLKEKGRKAGIVNNHNVQRFNPWHAILNQLVYNDYIKNNMEIEEKHMSDIEKNRYEMFVGNKEDSRQAVKEHIYNMIQKNYVGHIKQDGTYHLSKFGGNQRYLISQLSGYDIYKKQKMKK